LDVRLLEGGIADKWLKYFDFFFKVDLVIFFALYLDRMGPSYFFFNNLIKKLKFKISGRVFFFNKNLYYDLKNQSKKEENIKK